MGHRRRSPAGPAAADLRFALVLLFLAYAITLGIWAAHRFVIGALPGQSTGRVVIMGALFGSVSALSSAFLTARRGRLAAAFAGIAAAVLGYLTFTRVVGPPDGSALRDALPPLLGLGSGSVVCLGVLAGLARRR